MTNIYCLQSCIKRPITYLIVAILTCFFLLMNHYYSDSSIINYNHIAGLTRRKTSINEKYYDSMKNKDTIDNDKYQEIDSLLLRIEDLKRIKLSIVNELRLSEREKSKLSREKANLISKNEKLLSQIAKSKSQLKQLELDISANRRQKFEQNLYDDSNYVPPIIFNPLKSVNIEQFSMPNEVNNNYTARSSSGFDISQCSLAKEFKFYLLDSISSSNDVNAKDHEKFIVDPILISELLQSHRQYTRNISEACLIISLNQVNSDIIISRNILIINLIDSPWSESEFSLDSNVVVASSVFRRDSYLKNIHLIIPGVWRQPAKFETIIGSMPPQSPVERKYLASYFGRSTSLPSSKGNRTQEELSTNVQELEKTLQIIHRNSFDDLFLFIYSCDATSNLQCYEEKDKMVELSTFMIIIATEDEADNYSNELLYLALSRGTIPVIIGKEYINLPFEEVIDWRRATIMLPTARLPELHFILRSISPTDLYQLRYHGRRIFENYLATTKQILDTIISLMSLERFGYPPPAIQDVQTITYYPNDKLNLDYNCTTTECIETKVDLTTGLYTSEMLGPREMPFSSQSFRRNFSLVLNSAYDLWNNPLYSAQQLFPSYPNDPIPPSEYKFFAPERGFRPIADGLGGSGLEFSRSLGGDYPNEQFTIVLLTYERQSLLMRTLERLKGLPYLNKILIVWNGIKQTPAANMIWPDIGVPIIVVKVARNSLNNRFLPYDAIETDAILSLDDDSPLRPDEIVFAFRVWRESRDRIVGFPGRYHAWNSGQNSWSYNSNHSCELSMVLTGGAFFHKYYSYVYTYSMPEVIHSIVDKFMNCEDIAMNFLVAHLTRKPPIKVTSRWTFHCAGCTSSLSEDDSHFRERHECLNTFASIYGYMPLLSTQHRSDSVLFKTRLPHDKQKCFKFV